LYPVPDIANICCLLQNLSCKNHKNSVIIILIRCATGGDLIKHYILVLTVIILLVSISACGKNASAPAVENLNEGIETKSTIAEESQANENTSNDQEMLPDISGDTEETDSVVSEHPIDNNPDNTEAEILQSAVVDLDGDGISEQVRALKIEKEPVNGKDAELEGILSIKKGEEERRIPFANKYEGLTGLLTSIEFADLDGDGAKDVFIIIPENGASFTISRYFIYSHKKDISYSFTSDSELADFINGFTFKNTGDGKLGINNSIYNFSAKFTINEADTEYSDETLDEYEQRAWIDPVPVDIGENSRLALVKEANGTPAIKVPLPVFGLATVDMIGELDLFYYIDENFHPVLKRFEVIDINGAETVKIGSCEVNK